MTRTGLPQVCLALLLVGCSATWSRPGVTRTEVQQDSHACERESEGVGVMPTGPYGGLVLAMAQLGWAKRKSELFRGCMRARGYTTDEDRTTAAEPTCAGAWVYDGREVRCRP